MCVQFAARSRFRADSEICYLKSVRILIRQYFLSV